MFTNRRCHSSGKNTLLALMLASVLSCVGAVAETAAYSSTEGKTLVIHTYDSFVSEWGAGPKIAPLFDKLFSLL